MDKRLSDKDLVNKVPPAPMFDKKRNEYVERTSNLSNLMNMVPPPPKKTEKSYFAQSI